MSIYLLERSLQSCSVMGTIAASLDDSSKNSSSIKTSNFFTQISLYQQSLQNCLANTLSKLQHFARERFDNIKGFVEVAEDPLYMRAQTDRNFKKYDQWYRSGPRDFYRQLAKELKQGLSLEEFHQKVCHYCQAQKEILSPLAYAIEVERLADIVDEMKLSQNYKNVLNEVRGHLNAALKIQPNAAKIFLRDITYLIILLSGSQINGGRFLKCLKVYQGVLSEKSYISISKLLEDFIKNHQLETVDRYKLTTSKIKNHVYRELFQKIKASLLMNLKKEKAPLQKEYRFNDLFKGMRIGLKRGYGRVHRHPYLTMALAANLFGRRSVAWAETFKPSLDLANFSSADGCTIDGNGLFGYSMTGGDYNGDGKPDVIIGAPNSGSYGEVFGIYGTPSLPSNFNVADIGLSNSIRGFSFTGTSSLPRIGLALASGYINKDNYCDFLILPFLPSSPFQLVLVFGSGSLPLAQAIYPVSGFNGTIINGEYVMDISSRVLSCGDINKDGYDDILVGAVGQLSKGDSVAIFGAQTFPNPYSPNLNSTDGFDVQANTNSAYLGKAVCSGDINGDGIKDFITLAHGYAGGEIVVMFGFLGPFQATYALSSFNSNNSFIITPVTPYDFGRTTLLCKDINNDGIDDVLIGSSDALFGAGQVYGVYGSRSLPSSLILSNLNSTTGFTLNGTDPNSPVGPSIACADVDNDGHPDLLVGVPNALSGRGQIWGIYGPIPAAFNLFTLPESQRFVFNGITTTDLLGTLVITADLNADGVEDILMSIITAFNNAGRVYVYYGKNPKTGTTGNTSNVNSNSNASSDNISVIIGVIVGLALSILGGAGAYLYYRRRKSRSELDNIELQKNPELYRHTLDSALQGGHRIIGGKYALINKINKTEAKELELQEGIKVVFPPGKENVKIVLNEGQFGKLRLAKDLTTNTFVAVKKIKAEKIEASKNEAALQAFLTGKPNIMPLLDSSERKDDQGRPFKLYQFSLLAGLGDGQKIEESIPQLVEKVEKSRPQLGQIIKTKILVHIAKSILTGMKYMHEERVYHLDFKPNNMVIRRRGETYVIDLGCARKLKEGRQFILPEDDTLGDNNYFSPERLAFLRKDVLQYINLPATEAAEMFDPSKSDAWTVGVALWELAIGKFPFDIWKNDTEMLNGLDRVANWDTAYFTEKLKSLKALTQDLPKEYASLISGLLNPDPDKRLSIEDALGLPIFQRSGYQFTDEKEQEKAFEQMLAISPLVLSEYIPKKPAVSREEAPNYSRPRQFAQLSLGTEPGTKASYANNAYANARALF